jgi:hypothetical protein
MNTRIYRILFLLLILSLPSACGDKCEEMLNSVCDVRPNQALCAKLSFKVDKKKMSPELCGAIDEAYWEMLEKRAER